MQNTFSVIYRGQEIDIQPLPADKHSNAFYVAHLPGESLRIVYTEDDEGAGHWLDEKTNNETEISIEMGLLIELYLMQYKLGV
jgi:hypothetical protein